MLSLTFTTFKNVDRHLLKLGVLGSLSITLSQAMLGLAGKTVINPALLAALSFVFGQAGSTLTGPVISTTLTRVLSIELRGTMTGVQRTLETLGSSPGSFIAGVLYVVLGLPDPLLISSLFGLTATYYLLILLTKSIT